MSGPAVLFRALLAGVIVGLLGCAVRPASVAWSEPPQVTSGTAMWSTPRGQLVGQLVMESDSRGNLRAVFLKDLPAPLIDLAREASGTLTVRGALVGGGWRGPEASVPLRLQAWGMLASAWPLAVSAPAGKNSVQSARGWTTVEKPSAGKIASLRVVSSDTGDALVFRPGGK
jgi:hypothetical protein